MRPLATLFLFVSLAAAGSFPRRLLAGLACAASAVDGWESATYLDGHHGVRESNPWLSNPDGTIRIGPMISLKTVMCVGPAVAAELMPRRWKWLGEGSEASALGVFLRSDWRNMRLVK